MFNNREKLQRTFLTLFILLLLSTLTGVQSALANAADSTSELPSFVVISPMQKAIYDSGTVSLNLTISKPSTWFMSYYGTIFEIAIGEVTFVQYNLDGEKSENLSLNDPWDVINPPHSLDFSLALTELSEGQHNLNVSVYGRVNGETVVVYSPNIIFFIDAAPLELKTVSPESKVYNITDIPLIVTTTEPVFWMGYRLDEEDIITVTENTTSKGLSTGSHNLTIFGNDTIGNCATSETVTFTVTKPEPSPFPTAPVAAASAASIAVAGVGLLVYFRKRRH